MKDIVVEQALYGSQDTGGYRFLARSAGFLDEWLAEAEQLCTGFGERPAGVTCSGSVFAQPLTSKHIAIVKVADQGNDDAGRPGALSFHLLVLPQAAYAGLGGDPFVLAERCPPDRPDRGELPSLAWPAETPPRRTVEQVRKVLQRADGPNLLGGSQVLVDGGRLVFERPAPDPDLLRDLWTLLPTSTRSTIWPASFAFGNMLGFDALVVPRVGGPEYQRYVNEEQAGDYPQGRYELNLQIAAEAGDQRELDALFGRRSRAETWRLGLILLALVVCLTVVSGFLTPSHAPIPSKPQPDLPSDEHYPAMNDSQRERMTAALCGLAEKLGISVPAGATAETLLDLIDRHLGTPDPNRDSGLIQNHGPAQRRVRVLLWKHGLEDYNDEKLNPLELIERLQQKLLGEDERG